MRSHSEATGNFRDGQNVFIDVYLVNIGCASNNVGAVGVLSNYSELLKTLQ